MAARKRKHSLATRKLMSLKASGRKNPFYGRRHSKATLLKIARANKGKKNGMFGRRHSSKTIAKMRALALKRNR